MAEPTYATVKAAVIELVDDFTKKDVVANYAPKGNKSYDASTKLITLYINEPVLAVMPIRFNKVMHPLCPKWKDVGSLDLVDQETIGDLILLACGQCSTHVPAGEPS